MDMLQDPQYRTTDGSALRIFRDTAQNKFLSEREGRAIFDEVIFAEIISPGSRDSTPTFELVRVFAKEMGRGDTPKYGSKYPELKQFVDDFVKSEEHDSSLTGTPLSQWSEMTRSMVSALKSQSIFTVDALAALPDTRLIAVGPDGRTWRAKAIAYVENAKNSAYATELAARVEQMIADDVAKDAEITRLAAQVQELMDAAAKGGKAPKTPPAPAPEPPAEPADATKSII